METVLRLGLCLAVVAMLPTVVQAQDYTCSTNNGTITITGYIGSGGEVTITNMINGLPVTTIGDWAFYRCTNITSVLIGNNITNIGNGAFSSCARLASVGIGTKVSIIGGRAFYSCFALTDITIPDGVTDIGAFAFQGCRSLVNVTIPRSVTTVGNLAFYHCSSLTGITVNASNTVYSSVSGVMFDRSQTTLIICPGGKAGEYAIPSGVASIKFYAFESCGNLTTVEIPASVTNIGDYALSSCTSMTSFAVNTSNSFYSSVDGVLFNKNQTKLIQCPGGKTGNYRIPDGVTNIDDGAFSCCTRLMGITIPSDVTHIDFYAFLGCSSLVDVTIPASVTHIAGGIFNHCPDLKGVYFRGNVPHIDTELFTGTANATVYYSRTTTGWESFDYAPTVLWNPRIRGDADFGAGVNGFEFSITNAGSPVVVVEASTNLVNPVWRPVGTNRLIGGSSYFNDSEWTIYPARFYRICMP